MNIGRAENKWEPQLLSNHNGTMKVALKYFQDGCRSISREPDKLVYQLKQEYYGKVDALSLKEILNITIH